MTLKNVAVISGCSVSTVSKVFSNSAEISEETKQKVLKAASETGYFDKAAKRKPVLGAIKSLILVCDAPADEFSSLFASLSKTAKRAGFYLITVIGNEKDASLIMDQMGALGAVILSAKQKQDTKTVKFLEQTVSREKVEKVLQELIKDIESLKPVRIRTKKAGSVKQIEPAVQAVLEVQKSKKEEIWLL